MDLGERIEHRLAQLGWSQAELARRVGVKSTTIWKLVNGESSGSKHLHVIAKHLATSPEYLTGETDNPDSDILSDRRLADRAESSPQDAAAQLNSVLIPQLEIGYSMGGGSVFQDYVESAQIPFPRDWLAPMIRGSFAELFVARGDGDSMVPTLLDGDLVLVDTAQKTIQQQDRLWCLSYGDLGMIKRVRILPDGSAQINSDNPAVTPITAHDDEMHVIGRVIWIARRV